MSQDSKQYSCIIRFLDDSEPLTVTYQKDTKGHVLFDQVCRQLNLIEKHCFGLRFVDANQQRHWLDLHKLIYKQLKYVCPPILCFRVKFYASDPMRLKEEITRYFLFLQLRRDLHHGRLLCTPSDANWLAACIIQSEIGDFDAEEHLVDYVSQFRLLPKQTSRQEQRIAEHHKTMAGQTPAEAEANFLVRACQLDTYGVDPHPVKDQNGNQVYIGITHLGVVTFQGTKRTRVILWSQVTKITFEGKMFIVHIVVNEKKQAVGYKCPTLVACKHLWKCAVEQQYFYTLRSSAEIPKVTTGGGLFHRSSKFRYSGRCELEAYSDSSRITRDEPQFKRTSSNPVFVRAYSTLRAGSIPATFNALGLSNESLDSITHQAALSRSLEDFSAISPAMQRVVRGYHGASGQDPLSNGMAVAAGGFDHSVFSPHPSPTIESRPHLSSSCDTVSGLLSGNSRSNGNPGAGPESRCHADTITQQQSVLSGIDRTLAALFAVGISVVLAIIFILLGHDHDVTPAAPMADFESDF